MASWQLAQLNIAQLSAPIYSPQLADFVDNLDRINALAEQAPGFVWRYTEDVRTSQSNRSTLWCRQDSQYVCLGVCG